MPQAESSTGYYIDFPIAPLDLLRKMPWSFSGRMLADWIKVRTARSVVEDNFASVVRARYGRTLADALLLNYSAKLWGAPAERLSPAISGRRLQGLDLTTLLLELVRGAGARVRHLDGSFFYPRFGIGTLADALAGA